MTVVVVMGGSFDERDLRLTVEMNDKMDDVMDGGEEKVLLPRGVLEIDLSSALDKHNARCSKGRICQYST